jgi:hypothetical protein
MNKSSKENKGYATHGDKWNFLYVMECNRRERMGNVKFLKG